MTKQYDNELKGVLFKNEEKESDTHADYRGNATINGVDYFMDAWINTAESGRKYMAFRFKAKDKQPAKNAARNDAPRRQRGNQRDDDVPF